VRVQLRPHGLDARRFLLPRSVRHGLTVPGLRLGNRKEDRGVGERWQVLPAFKKYEVQRLLEAAQVFGSMHMRLYWAPAAETRQ
jgi:hypothetical protein